MATANASPKQFEARRVGGADEGENSSRMSRKIFATVDSKIAFPIIETKFDERARGHRPHLPKANLLLLWTENLTTKHKSSRAPSTSPPHPESHRTSPETRGEISVVNFPDRMHFCFTTPKCRAHRSNDVLFISMAIKCSVHVIWHYVNGLFLCFGETLFPICRKVNMACYVGVTFMEKFRNGGKVQPTKSRNVFSCRRELAERFRGRGKVKTVKTERNCNWNAAGKVNSISKVLDHHFFYLDDERLVA